MMKEDEKKIVGKMIAIYCRGKHKSRRGDLCEECATLKEYAFLRLERCRYGNEKPTCNSCPVHCYRLDMKQQIKEVMRFSGPKILFYYPIDALLHFYKEYKFSKKEQKKLY